MAHPAAGGPVPADVGESFVEITVRSTEGDFLDGLVDQQVLGGPGSRRKEEGQWVRLESLRNTWCPTEGDI